MDINTVELCGVLNNSFVFDHETHGKRFYRTSIIVQRASETLDVIPLIVAEWKITKEMKDGPSFAKVLGKVRTYNKTISENKKNTDVTVLVQSIEIVSGENFIEMNEVHLTGTICKNRGHSQTPKGRHIANFILAVNMPYGVSYYVPCICWGLNSVAMDEIPVGTKVEVFARFQSRTYMKEDEEKTAYEISVSNMEVLDERD